MGIKADLASAITKAASTQTYYTIRFLVDRPRMADAYRAYAYFRWLDDALDAESPPGSGSLGTEHFRRQIFLDRQKSLLDQCLRGETPRDTSPHEAMLVELVRHTAPRDLSLEAYLRNMMLVMDFDVRRRGQLVSEAELSDYTRWLAVAVTEAMQFFIGNGTAAPHDETRYLAVEGAHILHMLRDTFADVRAGYFNIPREVLAAHSIGPDDVHSDAYRAWVADRVRLAHADLDGGKAYFTRAESRRHRLAGLAYIARFEWLIETLEREDFRPRDRYGESRALATGLHMIWDVVSWMTGFRAIGVRSPTASLRDGRT
ncbi:MAG TPA: squalene/phytoene synthase family protein [Candidatus Polarisedimenticolia bacterium]|nr:squalene/phytoene synthase family protein [Candidatus Polarisedimenticolia bacterium]